jgi:signal transduction histidine kinase/putative methionine-R-sulfoxide reductase with GAF domain
MGLFARSRPELPRTPDKWKAALEAALTVSEIASSATALPDAIRSMVRAARELVRADQGSIMLLDDSERNLVLVASSGLPAEVPLGYTLKVGESVAGRVIATGKPLRLGDVQRDSFVNFVPKARPISSSVVVPLRVQGRSIGVLNLASSASSPEFTDDDLRLAQMFADQAAGLIYRASLHEKAEQRSSDLMALVESSKGLVGALQLDSLLERMLDGSTRLMGSKDGFACTFDPETGAIARGVFRGVDKQTIGVLVDQVEVKRAVENLELVQLENESLGTLIALGLRTTHGTKAVLVVGAEPERVDERHDLMRAFGQQCATALGAAELHSEVQRKESQLSSMIQGVPHPIVLVDAAKRIVAINFAAEELFGLSRRFAAGQPAEGALGHREIEEMLTGDGQLQGEVVAGNPPRTYKMRAIDVRVPGTPAGRVLIMDDVSSEREIDQMQRDFVAMIGHELRTPLTIIKGFARTLLKRADSVSSDEMQDGLATIDRKAARLEHLIEDLLYVSRIEAREASLRVELIDFLELVRSGAEGVVKDYKDREVTLDLPKTLEWPCDEAKVALVLRHLIDNGLKYSEAPNPVTVRVYEDEEELRIDVIDRGGGLVSSDIPHVFDRFRQLDASSTREHGGTGVGLYLCSQLVRAHKGRIWVESTWGKGSTFSFSLPRGATRSDLIRVHEGGQAAQTA